MSDQDLVVETVRDILAGYPPFVLAAPHGAALHGMAFPGARPQP